MNLKSFLLLMIKFIAIDGNYIKTKFLTNFFKDRSVMITASLCWDLDDLKYLLRSTSEQKKLLSVFNNLTELEHFPKYLATNNYFVVDLINCETSWTLLEQVNHLNYFRYPLKWLLLIDSKNFDKLKLRLQTYPIYPTSDVLVAEFKENNAFQIFQCYRIDSARNLILEEFGYWSEAQHLTEPLRYVPFTQRRSDLQRTKINVTVVIRDEDTWEHLDDFKYPQTDLFTKESWPTLKCVLEYCNADYSFIKTDNFGYLNKTSGKWGGVVGDLYYGRAQFAGSTPLFNLDRAPAVDFLSLISVIEIKFMMKRPPLSYMSNIFVLPFYWTVWVAILLVMVLFAIVSYVVLNWETRFKKKINFQNNFGINDIILIVFEILCQQGTMTEPKSIPGRIISLIFLTSFMFIFVAYSANIVALLQSTTEITSLEQLLNSRMTVAAEDVYYMKNYLTAAKDPIRKELYNTKILPAGFYSLEEGTEKIRQGFFALHMEVGAGYNYILKTFTDAEVCSLQKLDGYAKSPGGYSCVPKNSPYKKIFKVGLLRIDEFGIRKRNVMRISKKPKCHSKGASFASVGIMDVYPAILFWVYGVLMALLILAIEITVKKIQNKRSHDRITAKRRLNRIK